MPCHTLYDYDEFHNAMRDIRRQRRKKQPLVWTGPDKFHSAIAATSSPPSWQFSEEGLEYHKERGRSFEDICTLVTFHFAYHQATVAEEKNTEFYKKTADFWQKEALSRPKAD